MSKVLIDLYERALKASWPYGAKGEACNLWNEARLLQQEPDADCGLEVVGVLCVSRFRNNPAMENVEFHPAADVEQGQHDLIRKSDADARIAAIKATHKLAMDAACGEIAELEAQLSDEDCFRLANELLEEELAALKAQEPVAWLHHHFDGRKRVQFPGGVYDQDAGWGAQVEPLYAAPVKQEVVMPEFDDPELHAVGSPNWHYCNGFNDGAAEVARLNGGKPNE